jgi:hypothetical protein
MVGKDPESLTDELRISSDLKRTVIQCVYHVSLSVSPSEKLSEQKWIDIARTYLQGMEFQTNQYAIYRHTDREHDHIHIIASRIRISYGVDGVAFQGRQLGKDYAWTSLESLLSQESSYQPSQIRRLPYWQHRETRDIDMGVTLLLLKAGESLAEAKMILTQSDRVKQWHQELPREAFLNVAKQYIRQVTNQASELGQKYRGRETVVELE